jgi:hypothetical protein
MVDILIVSCFITTTLLIWFKSDAFVEYAKLLHLHRIFKIKEYEEKRLAESFQLTYTTFLRMTSDRFLIRLITCPLCVSFWLSLIGLFFVPMYFIPIVYVSTLLIYGVITRLLNI